MSATALQLNWTNVQFASTNITRVTSVMFSQGGELIEFSGDNNRYPVVIANSINRPRCSITSGDVYTLTNPAVLAPGMSGTIIASQLDALGASGGTVDWQLQNAVHENTDNTGQWGQFATATATFRAYSSDGVTNPLSVTGRT
jgi:hypothetical protein